MATINGRRRSWPVLLLLAALWLLGSAVFAAPEDILPLKDVKVGMKGIGRTVIRGREIETFNVEVMGILINNKINENVLINGKSILVRVSGKVIDDAGGIAAGMSGSPIYINNKLIGGLSSGWVMTDHTVGLVTPIEEMLEIWDYPLMSAIPGKDTPEAICWVSPEPVRLGDKPCKKIWECHDPVQVAGLAAPGDAVFQHAGTPVVIQGLRDRAASLLGRRLQKRGLNAVQQPPAVSPEKKVPAPNRAQSGSVGGASIPGPGTGSISGSIGAVAPGIPPATVPNPPPPTTPIPGLPAGTGSVGLQGTASGAAGAFYLASDSFEPGSAVGVQLARGDVNLTTLGTLTYRDGKRILAFAHSFLKKGNVSYLMTMAHVYHSFSSVQMPFKIGAPTEVIGMITQDREKAIGGEIGRFPAMVPVQLEVTDRDLKRTRSINYQVVRDPSVLVSVLESTLLQAIDGVIDRNGEGTAVLGITFECQGSSGQKYTFRRDNLYFSRGDIVDSLIGEVNELVDSVVESELEEVVPLRLALKVELERKRRTLTIEKVEVKNTSVTPGGVLEVWVTMRPFREKSLVQKAKIPIPHDIGKENLRLTVFGMSSRVQDGDPQSPDSGGLSGGSRANKAAKTGKPAEELHRENFDQMVHEWSSAPKNSDLVFQITAETDDEKKIKVDGKDYFILPTNLVVQGSVDTTITLSED